jgi:hypothetical protein
MALHDGTPRETYTEPPNTQGDRPRPPMSTSIVSTIVVLLVLVIGIFGAFYQGNRQVTNAPANTPPSTQQPDTTPPTNQAPAR